LKASLAKYNKLLAPARQRFEANAGLNVIGSTGDPRSLELFLLYFCAIGAQMTEPVEGWIHRAGDRCAALGFSELAEGLRKHARAESGHHLMMVADLWSLTNHWNARHTPAVRAEDLVRQEPSPGALRYRQVHEDNIAGDTPYAQIAIEYEIERLPLLYGDVFIARCLETFGVEILPGLSFITAHIDLDVGHTKFNAQELARLIDRVPETLEALVAAGSAALDAYGQFLTDCVELADRHRSLARTPSRVPSQFLSWQLRSPQRDSSGSNWKPPGWLNEVRSLRGSVLFDHGRRPGFKTKEGHYVDLDPIDPYAYHVLAYDGATLAGCVRIYPLAADGPRCLTETLIGEKGFSEMLMSLGSSRDETFEIGRWVTNSALKTHLGLAATIGLQLAAGAGVLALALANHAGFSNGLVLSSVGTRDGQDLLLSRFGLTAVPGIDPVRCDYYDDTVQVTYCAGTQRMQPRFLRAMKAMASVMGLEQVLGASASFLSSREEHVGHEVKV
jgi:Acetyltransferase (GNAT) domain